MHRNIPTRKHDFRLHFLGMAAKRTRQISIHPLISTIRRCGSVSLNIQQQPQVARLDAHGSRYGRSSSLTHSTILPAPFPLPVRWNLNESATASKMTVMTFLLAAVQGAGCRAGCFQERQSPRLHHRRWNQRNYQPSLDANISEQMKMSCTSLTNGRGAPRRDDIVLCVRDVNLSSFERRFKEPEKHPEGDIGGRRAGMTLPPVEGFSKTGGGSAIGRRELGIYSFSRSMAIAPGRQSGRAECVRSAWPPESVRASIPIHMVSRICCGRAVNKSPPWEFQHGCAIRFELKLLAGQNCQCRCLYALQ